MNNIQKWNQVQEELKEGSNVQVSVFGPPSSVKNHVSKVYVHLSQALAPSNPPSSGVTPEPVETEFEYSDTTAMACLLCARQFKSLEQLKRHNKESDLHKVCRSCYASICGPCLRSSLLFLIYLDDGLQKNFRDPNLREVARQKVAAGRKVQSDADAPKYRDRASERRIMHNQPEIPIPENNGAATKKKRHVEGPPSPP